MHRGEEIFLPLVIILFSLGDVLGTCDPIDSCPPPFPDFMSIFAETLKKIQEQRVDNWTFTDCPTTVNWTDFNSRLESGDPVPLDPECSRPTTPSPTGQTQSDVSTTSFVFLPPTKTSSSPAAFFTTGPEPWLSSRSSSGSNETVPLANGAKQSDDSRNIGLPVGVAVGAALLILIFVVVAVVVCRRRAKRKAAAYYLRNQSTTSHDVLTPELDIPDTPQIQQNVILIPGYTCQESSTDGTIRRPTGGVAVVVIERNASDEMEDLKGSRGCDNKAFEAAEGEQEDPGYAGSEECQENWENEWNNKFEEALMESNEKFPQDEAKDGKGETDSDSPNQKTASRSSILRNTSKDLPSATKSTPLNSPSAEMRPALKFNLPSSTTTLAYPVVSSSPTKPSPSSLSSPSAKKKKHDVKFNLPPPTNTSPFPVNIFLPTKEQTSPFSRSSPTNWPAFGVDQASTPSKPHFEQRPAPLTSDAPPAYLSPIVEPNGSRPFDRTRHRESSVHSTPPATPPTASSLPTYTEVMAATGIQSSTRPGPNTPQKQQRPSPPRRLDLAAAASPSTLLNTQHVESSAHGNSNPWKMQVKRGSKAAGEPEKQANTAVVRPWTGGAGPPSEGRESALRSTPVPAAANPATATEETPSDSVGEYSFRPVRSLLSQFEAENKNNP